MSSVLYGHIHRTSVSAHCLADKINCPCTSGLYKPVAAIYLWESLRNFGIAVLCCKCLIKNIKKNK